MKKLGIVLVLLIVSCYTLKAMPDGDEQSALNNTQTEVQSYQQFKMAFATLNDNLQDRKPAAYAMPYRSEDYTMLYVAGGIVVASVALILLNNPNNYESNSVGEVNSGIAIGGGIAAGMFTTKFFLDKKPF